MTKRIEHIFQQKGKEKLTIYFTAGYPNLEDTGTVLKALDKADVDIIEIGMPYSDPLADGPVIQQSSMKALENGMNLNKLFEQLADLRKITDKPVFIMGYCNNVLKYGTEKFCQKCAEVGVDGLILPDMPMHEFKLQFKPIFEKYNLKNVFLITPKTSEERIREVDAQEGGFIYMVSSSSTTGGSWGDSPERLDYLKRIQAMNLKTPRMVGFGISDHEALSMVNQHSDGGIIGSAFIKALDEDDLEGSIERFVEMIKPPSPQKAP
ncbi:tryptophan synthase alpha chain [Marivirga tractuosa]|uniref:Tryptophan synthase alpha chain n=1 Tax=Marivirga tractuosa (strain ATCC 23168 / DSM 4126 / NBRC 15989 / NCIMB 1408 / VKM B-1430 / H-43) TaxID=643867 RepID=E4TUA7_MARTH|nr:tryptophan synthase subunit alpha [Marivirga tractuosa]ADR21035.1 tryptophan synthase, alpha chain [Marivirga tractuosa DSM 4126]BDD14510.1 tryptophan synthase alpha chain [Marivirga tractuosa]